MFSLMALSALLCAAMPDTAVCIELKRLMVWVSLRELGALESESEITLLRRQPRVF